MKRTTIPIGITPSLRGVDALLADVGDFLQPLVTFVMREYWKRRKVPGWRPPLEHDDYPAGLRLGGASKPDR
jgi:hypothetical protein